MNKDEPLPTKRPPVARVFTETDVLTARVDAALAVSRRLEAYLAARSM